MDGINWIQKLGKLTRTQVFEKNYKALLNLRKIRRVDFSQLNEKKV